jgi:hypothetical protein
MFKRSSVHRQGSSPTGFLTVDALDATLDRLSLSPMGLRFLSSSVVAFAAALLLASRMDLGVMGIAVQDAVLSSVIWEWLFTRVHLDEVVLISTARSVDFLRVITPGVGNELAAAFAMVVAVVLIAGWASKLSLAETLSRRRAFMRRLDCRDKSFHYSCDQFWLRVQGR